jgi:D-glycerate 3-kinase
MALKAQKGPEAFVVGINGMPGIGKSTLASELSKILLILGGGKRNIVCISIDDFYYSCEERSKMSMMKWGLGAHDIKLAVDTIMALKHASASSQTSVPRFDKKIRDRLMRPDIVAGEVDFILFEGFGLGYASGGYEALAKNIDYLITLRTERDAWKKWRTDAARMDGNETLLKNIESEFREMEEQSKLVTPYIESRSNLIIDVGKNHRLIKFTPELK